MVRAANRCPNTGDDRYDEELEDVSEEMGLGHALATRTPGPKMRRGEADPLRLGMGMGPWMKEREPGKGLWSSEGDNAGFADWSGSNCVGLDADVVETVEAVRNFW